jgi:hypothetical protein
MTLFAVSFDGQGQPFDCEAVKDALIFGIRHALRPRETDVGLGSELLRLRRKLEHLNAPSADTGTRAGVIRHYETLGSTPRKGYDDCV